MKKVNLRDLYPDVYKNDHFLEVTDVYKRQTEIRMGNTVLVVSGFFKKDTTDTAADNMMKVLDVYKRQYWNNLNTELEAIPINESELP